MAGPVTKGPVATEPPTARPPAPARAVGRTVASPTPPRAVGPTVTPGSVASESREALSEAPSIETMMVVVTTWPRSSSFQAVPYQDPDQVAGSQVSNHLPAEVFTSMEATKPASSRKMPIPPHTT